LPPVSYGPVPERSSGIPVEDLQPSDGVEKGCADIQARIGQGRHIMEDYNLNCHLRRGKGPLFQSSLDLKDSVLYYLGCKTPPFLSSFDLKTSILYTLRRYLWGYTFVC